MYNIGYLPIFITIRGTNILVQEVFIFDYVIDMTYLLIMLLKTSLLCGL